MVRNMMNKVSIKTLSKRALSLAAAAVVLVGTGAAAITGIAHAAVNNPAPAAKVSFTFDDGLASAYTQAAPTLAKYGLSGTNYVITSCVGMTKAPNTCHANTDATYMSWAQIKTLQSTYKWEIGSHTDTHPYLATFDAGDGQPKALTAAQVVKELTDSKNKLAAQGINATSFATPYGDYNNATLAQIAKLYSSHRGFADEGLNGWPNNDYLLYDMRVQAGVSVAQVEAKIDQAIANKQWVVLTFHDILPKASTNPDDYQYNTADLDKIAAYVKTKINAGQIQPTNVSQGLVTGTTTDNLLPNSSFDGGISSGWTTDNATAVTKDTANNGNYPSATNSIKFSPSTKPARLYSPQVSVDSNTSYLLKNFLNVQARTSGEMEFYIDEYDVNGNWISGQYKKAEPSVYVENLNFMYKPTSAAVAKASLQITSTANSGITAYLDNVQWMALNGSASVPVPPTPGLLANGGFETGLTSWTTDDAANIVADNTGKGSPNNPQNSVRLTANATKTTHLFSAPVAVLSTQTYSITSYANLLTLNTANGGELGFYIDEYDANGNWVSGQYKFGMHNTGAGNVSFSYKPTAANVAKASLQVIVVGNSNLTGYFDDVRWYAAQ